MLAETRESERHQGWGGPETLELDPIFDEVHAVVALGGSGPWENFIFEEAHDHGARVESEVIPDTWSIHSRFLKDVWRMDGTCGNHGASRFDADAVAALSSTRMDNPAFHTPNLAPGHEKFLALNRGIDRISAGDDFGDTTSVHRELGAVWAAGKALTGPAAAILISGDRYRIPALLFTG